MEHTMVQTARAVLFATLFVFCWLVVPPASAHTGAHPHVPAAHFKPSNHIVFDKQNVANGWHFYAAMHNIGQRLGPGPQFHEGECEAHPNWACVEVATVNNPSLSYVRWNPDPNWTPQHGYIRLNIGAGFPADISGSCRTIAGILGLHPYRSGVGCMHDPWTLAANRLGESGMNALRNAYR